MKTRKLISLAVTLSVLGAVYGCAQQPQATGSAASAGPEKLGKVSFSTSCDPKVQAQFERGVALLHSFWWEEGEKTFREVLERDPHCAIASWGIATILVGNTFALGPSPQGLQRAREALARGRAIGAKTERERLFIEAIGEYYERFEDRLQGARMKSLANAFEIVAKRFPGDDEAQIFYAIYLTATQSPTDKTYASALKAAEILEVQYAKYPDHPGVAHYLIHSYDSPPLAEKGRKAAKRYAEIAPSAPHALHMPSHIFTRVGAWAESAVTNQRSASIAKTDDRLHAMDYMVYAYLQLARDKEASLVIEEAQRVTAPFATRAGPYAVAAMPARYTIERGAWKEAAQLQPDRRASKFRYTESMTYFARALGAARSGEPAAAEKDVQVLAGLVNALKAAKDGYWATEVEVQRLAAAAWTAYAKGNRDEALALMRSAANMEDKSEKSAVTPGRIVPARELLGEMLLEFKRPAEALKEFESSAQREPNRFRGLAGAAQAAAQAGDPGKAKQYYVRLVELAGNGEPRPELARAKAYLAQR